MDKENFCTLFILQRYFHSVFICEEFDIYTVILNLLKQGLGCVVTLVCVQDIE